MLLSGAMSYGADDGAHWGYEDDIGPDHWASLSEANTTCATGTEQSPIDLRHSQPVARADLVRAYGEQTLNVDNRELALDMIDNGHTIQVSSADAKIAMTLDNTTYTLVQMHFHAPSEHTLEGRHWPLEAHYVMSTNDGKLAVLGVLFAEGAHDAAFDPIIAALPNAEGEERHLQHVDPQLENIVPAAGRYYLYAGSLTTPPCTEGLTWVVMAEPADMSGDQLAEFTSRLHGNARPTQPLGERELLLVSP